MTCGIYKIENIKNNKCYIGCSINIEHRWKQHIYELNSKKHHSKKLQSAWNKYGDSMFEFKILECCESEELFIREKYHIFINNSFLNGYNMIDGNDDCFQSKSSLTKYYYDNKHFVDYFILCAKKFINNEKDLKFCKYRYSNLNINTKNSTPLNIIKCFNMLINMQYVLDTHSNENKGLYFSYINYHNNAKGEFEFKTLNKIGDKWFLNGKRNYNHTIWNESYSTIMEDFIENIYHSKHKYLICFFKDCKKYITSKRNQNIILFIKKNKINIIEKDIILDDIKNKIYFIHQE